MISVISPAKSLNFETPSPTVEFSQPKMLSESEKLMNVLKKKSPKSLEKLMDISQNLAQLNFERNQLWSLPFTPENAKQAVFAFDGEVYNGLNANDLTFDEIDLLQKRVRILSGLYGLLKPLDLIQPYRLEMGTGLKTTRGKNLYEFWKSRITDELNLQLQENEDNHLVNLASAEYFKAIKVKQLKAKIYTPNFLDYSSGKFKVVQFFAKKARGLMVRFIAQNHINQPNDLKAFDYEGYRFDPKQSTEFELVFKRQQKE